MEITKYKNKYPLNGLEKNLKKKWFTIFKKNIYNCTGYDLV